MDRTLHDVVQADARVRLLLVLEDRARTRAELQERTGTPRATVSRNLRWLIDAACLERREDQYALTPLGAVVAEGLGDLCAAVESPADPLDCVAFLLRAESRVAVLRALEERALSRAALVETTGVPRTTVRRTLADLRDRDVVRRDGSEYGLTATGERFIAGLLALEARVETVRRLGAIEPWLPTGAFDFDLLALVDADVTLPGSADPLAPLDRTYRRLLEADRFWMVSGSATPDTLEACWRAMTTDRYEVVVPADLLDVVSVDTRGAGLPPEAMDGGGLYLTDRPIPCNLAIADGAVLLRVHDEAGAVAAVVESDAPAVRRWAEGIRATFEASIEPVDPAAVLPSSDPTASVEEADGRADPELVATIRRVYEDAWGGAKDLDLIDDYVGQEFARHMAYNPDLHGAAEYKAFIDRFHEAFPDVECAVEEIVPRGDRYFFRWRAWGTQVRPVDGIEPPDEPVEFSGMTMARFEDGDCVEEWAFADRTTVGR